MNTTSPDVADEVQAGSWSGQEDLAAREFRHDLRQPLVTVGLLVDTVLSTSGLPPEIIEPLDRIRQQTDWMGELLRSMEVDQPEIAVVDLGEAVEGTCLATPEGAPYDVRFDRVDRTCVLVDPIGLKRSAWNLMDNARRAVAHGGSVQVRVRRHHRDAVLEVADSGPGFGRLPAHQGHGLVGVRRFAERFGGEFCVGVSPLGGALVTLRLPIAFDHAVGFGQ